MKSDRNKSYRTINGSLTGREGLPRQAKSLRPKETRSHPLRMLTISLRLRPSSLSLMIRSILGNTFSLYKR